VYVSTGFSQGITVFSRDAGTGNLTFVETEAVTRVDDLAISSDGADLYGIFEGGLTDGFLTRLDRDATTGALTSVELIQERPQVGVADVRGIAAVTDVAMSPDGARLYLVTGSPTQDNHIAVFERDGGDGALTLASIATTVTGLGPTAFSPDGAHAYALLTPPDDGLGVFARDPSGSLTFLEEHHESAGGVAGLDSPRAVAVSPDGAHVYVVSAGDLLSPSMRDDAIAAFARDPGSGALTFVEAEIDSQGGVDSLDGARGVALSPDGDHVYVASWSDDAVTVFARDSLTGALSVVEVERDGQGGVDGLDGAAAVAVSPDGGYVYVASQESAVAVFARDALSGALNFVEVEREGENDVQGLYFARALVLSEDGLHVYVAGAREGSGVDAAAVSVFARDPGTGGLAFLEAQVHGHDGVIGLGTGDRYTPSALQLSADGRTLYVAGETLVSFARSPTTGRLGLLETKTPLGPLTSVVATPDGEHVYATLPLQFFPASPMFAAFAPGFSGCSGPLAGCRTASGGKLRIVGSGRKSVSWKWTNGPATALGDFGQPDETTSYAFCVYDESGPTPTLLLRMLAPAGGLCASTSRPCWLETTEFRYRDSFLTPEAIKTLRLRPGDAGMARMILVGQGPLLEPAPQPFGLPVRAQLESSDGECWEATYSAPNVNHTKTFVSRAD
jgi:6-phosphogluconolactonase (cycloisomerase 2 family)